MDSVEEVLDQIRDKMRRLFVVGVIVILGSHAVFGAAIPKEHKEEPKEEAKPEEQGEDWELNLEYGRYLKEVVQALESDPEFRKKLETAEIDDIKSGKIARELHFVDHNIRTKLDELKRREVERLRHLATREHEKKAGIDRAKLKMPGHVDFKSHTRFEVEDLKRLIVKTTEDLEKVDQERKKEFQTYEMEKEFERKQELNAMDEEHKKAAEKKHEEEIKTHKDHPKLHEPGSKAQYEEVWEEQDHMKDQDFDPRTFFHLHDLDGNGYWDESELKSLFLKELDKMYDPNAPEDDIHERYEEMERMREHVFRESDKNKDQLISFEEFLDQTKKSEFGEDDGWKGLDEEEIYSQQEYEEYERQRQEEIARLVESGADPAAAAAAAQPVIQQPAQQQQAQQPVGQQQVPQQPIAQQQPAVQPIAGQQQAGHPVPLQPVAAQGQPIAQQPPVQQQPIAQQQPIVQQQPVH